MPWITPTDPPGSDICIKVYCPAGQDYEACLRGAIYPLTLPENWEVVTGQPASEVAEAFFLAYQKTLEWRRCVPVGTVLTFAGTVPPEGTLLCDGASLDTSDYSALFDAIGYNFGGSGSNFNLPNLTDDFPLLTDVSGDVANSGGEVNHTLNINEMPEHRHTARRVTTYLDEPVPGIVADVIEEPLFPEYTGYEGGGAAHNNMPPYVTFLAIIVAF